MRTAQGKVMELTKESAADLCRRVVELLVHWPVFPALLQVGGIETRASSRILSALEAWLENQQRTDLLVVPEYRLSSAPPTDETTDSSVIKAADQLFHGRIDYALVTAESIGRAALNVDTVIEVKTNYLCQSELQKRPIAARDQARAYAKRCGVEQSYVLYIVASAIGVAPNRPRDAGWAYYTAQPAQVAENGPIAVPGVDVLGCFPEGPDGQAVQWPAGAPGFSARIWACVLRGAT